jgi:hypothetical protein
LILGEPLLAASPATAPPDASAASPAPHYGQIIGEYEQAERYHPEAEDWQEAQTAADHQAGADADPAGARPRHRDLQSADRHSTRLRIETELAPLLCLYQADSLPFTYLATQSGICADAPQPRVPAKWDLAGDKARKLDFFAKSAWQNGKAFVLPAAHTAATAVVPW